MAELADHETDGPLWNEETGKARHHEGDEWNEECDHSESFIYLSYVQETQGSSTPSSTLKLRLTSD